MPKRFFFWDALPKSGYGKVPKRLVRDELEARGLLDLTKQATMRASCSPARPRPSASNGWKRAAVHSRFTLEAGLPLLEAARRGFAAQGFAGGTLNIGGGALGPFAYVMPALSRTGENAAFYSDTFRPAGVTRLKTGAMTLGRRDGAPSSIVTRCGLRLMAAPVAATSFPRKRIVAEPFAAEAFGLDGAIFTAEPDAETNFKLFGPGQRRRAGAEATPAALSRCGCGRTRILPARWKGSAPTRGIARASFTAASAAPSAPALTDGRRVEPFATELAVSSGMVEPGLRGLGGSSSTSRWSTTPAASPRAG